MIHLPTSGPFFASPPLCMRTVYFYKDGHSVQREGPFPPPEKVRVKRPNSGATVTFKLRKGSWAPLKESQVAVYIEQMPRKKRTVAPRAVEAPPPAWTYRVAQALVDADPGDER